MTRLLAVIAAACWPVAAQVNGVEKLFSLRGQIIDGGTGRPVSGAELELETPQWEPVGKWVSSDSDGRFLFPGLSAGRYILSASRPDFGRVHYGERQDGEISTFAVGPDMGAEPVLFRIPPLSTITGTVRDNYGDPVEQAAVTASRLTWIDGKIVAASAGQSDTDDRGRYRLNRLRPGAYAVCAAARSSTSAPSFLEQADARMRDEAHVFARACYPAANASSESRFRIAAGQRLEVDLALETISAVSLRGRVINGPKGGVFVQLFRDGFLEGWQFQSAYASAEAPTFEFRGIEPGRYRLEARSKGPDADGVERSLMTRLTVEVGRSDLNGLELALEPAGAIEVALHIPEGGQLGTGTSTVGLRSTVSNPRVTYWPANENGVLRLVDLAPGSYWLLTRTEEGVCITSAKLGGREALHDKVTVTPGITARLDVTLSANCSSVTGATLSGGKPVPYANVLVLLSGSAADPGDMIVESADEKGEFLLNGLGPGRYNLWAWRNDEDGYFPGPASLASEEAKATAIVLAAGEAAKADVTLLGEEARTR
jgi:protocatechuate 3,4-dioxygenase beta subunit